MTQYRKEIDGLRALAVLSVILNHFFPERFPNGFLGVDSFFVISGFVITAMAMNNRNLPITEFLLQFYARRIKRLLPVLVVCVVVSGVLISLVDPTPDEYLKTGAFALLGLSNLYLYWRSVDYFADLSALNPFTQTWSLGVEEQFYLFYPILFWVIVSRLSSRTAVILFTSLVALSFLLWWITSSSNPMFAFYIVAARFWQIGIGVIAFACQNGIESRLLAIQNANVIVGIKTLVLLPLIALLFFPLPVSANFAAVAVCALSSVVLILVGKMSEESVILGNRFSVGIGRMSYSLYLWHWPVLVLLTWTIGIGFWTALFGIALSLMLGLISYRFVENPLRYKRWADAKFKEIGVGVLVAGALFALIGFQVRFFNLSLYAGKNLNLISEGVETLTKNYISKGGVVWAGEECVLSSNSEVGDQINVQRCLVGHAMDADKRLLVLGNSFSAAFVEAFDQLDSGSQTVAAIVTSAFGASAVQGVANGGAWNEASAYYWSTIVPSLISQLQPGDIVLLVNYLGEFSPAVWDQAATERLELLTAGLERFSAQLAQQDLSLAVVGPLPFAHDAVCDPSVASPQWFAPDGGPCKFISRQDTIGRMELVSRAFSGLESRRVLEVVDLFDVFCGAEICSYINDQGTILYRDVYSHPSVEAARLSRPEIERFLRRHLR